jgi:peptidylprolyl isomerase
MGPKFLKNRLAVFLVIFIIFIAAMIAYSMVPKPESFRTKVLLVTSMGNITIGLYDDMPITTANFKNLTQLGSYDNTIFHRVVANFVVQGGDPTGTGNGDPRISSVQDELPNRHSNIAGTVAMAKVSDSNGSIIPNSASSQFFINLKDNSANLDSGYSVFGKVTDGMDVVQSIGRVETYTEGTLKDRPKQDVQLIKAILLT